MMRYSDPAGRMGATRDFSDLGRNGAVVYSKILRPGGTGAMMLLLHLHLLLLLLLLLPVVCDAGCRCRRRGRPTAAARAT